ncbi:hypothetical protein AVEN_60714-1, partial [Araneus ventricosus]
QLLVEKSWESLPDGHCRHEQHGGDVVEEGREDRRHQAQARDQSPDLAFRQLVRLE